MNSACTPAIDYKRDDVAARLRELAPTGVDVYSRQHLAAGSRTRCWQNLALNARDSDAGGQISAYNADGGDGGPRHYLGNLLMKRALVKGSIVTDYRPAVPRGDAQLAAWHAEGRLKYRVDVQPWARACTATTLNRLFHGTNQGKLVVRIADETV
jgi:NADPH-dependent curcumin reductase CurA